MNTVEFCKASIKSTRGMTKHRTWRRGKEDDGKRSVYWLVEYRIVSHRIISRSLQEEIKIVTIETEIIASAFTCKLLVGSKML